MVEISERASSLAPERAHRVVLPRLREVARPAWHTLATGAVEPNGYYLPEWALAVDTSARGRSDVAALCGFDRSHRLIALVPVISAWRAFRLPLPVLVAAESYGTLRTPLLAKDDPVAAAQSLMEGAVQAGTHALVLRDVPLEGAVADAFRSALARDGLAPIVLRRYLRAGLDATADAEASLRDALGTKKLKDLRRQRRRLDEAGALSFTVATTPAEAAAAVETFLALEASGWKAGRGTALAQHPGDAAFIRRATVELAATGQCEIAVLASGGRPIAAGVIVKHQDRAFWFKLGIDEHFAQASPGAQLAIALTERFCADPSISFVDSTAPADNPLVGPMWRSRFAMGDLLIPLKRRDPLLPIIRAALAARERADDAARHAVRFARRMKTKLRR